MGGSNRAMSEHIADAALGVILLLVLWSFYKAQRDPTNSLNLFDLVMENGRISRIAVAFLVALLVTSWVLIIAAHDTARNLDVIFSAYGAMWVAPIVAKLFSPPQVTTSTQTTSSTQTTTPVKPEPFEHHDDRG